MKPFQIVLFPVVATLLIAAGCEVGPNYKTPRAEISGAFDTGPELLPTTLPTTPTTIATTTQPTSPTNASISAATRVATQPSVEPVDLTHWWTALNDPELDSLVSRAIDSNLDISIAAAHVQEVRETYNNVAATALPVFGASGAIARGSGSNSTRGRVDAPLNAGTNTAGLKEITHVVGFDAGWELDLFGQLARSEEAANADVQSSMEARNQVLVSALADLSRSYINLRSAQLRLQITNDNIAALKRTVDLTKVSLRLGIGTELDVVLSERQLSAALARVGPIEASIRQSERQIAVLVGEKPESLYAELDQPGEIPAMLARVDPGLPIELLRRRPDVRQAERNVAAATARIGVATSALFPQVGITAGVGIQGQGLGRTPVETDSLWSAGPFFRAPILDFGALDALVKAQDYRTQQLLLTYRKTILGAMQEVEDAMTNYDSERNRFDQLTVAVATSQQALNLATERYRRGLTDFLNVLDAQRQLYDLEDQLASSRQQVSIQLIALFKSLGGGWEGFDAIPAPATPQPAIVAAGRALGHPEN
jgi:NodT family efflux transporter outer membrane factor (OMF) lipoprotein